MALSEADQAYDEQLRRELEQTRAGLDAAKQQFGGLEQTVREAKQKYSEGENLARIMQGSLTTAEREQATKLRQAAIERAKQPAPPIGDNPSPSEVQQVGVPGYRDYLIRQTENRPLQYYIAEQLGINPESFDIKGDLAARQKQIDDAEQAAREKGLSLKESLLGEQALEARRNLLATRVGIQTALDQELQRQLEETGIQGMQARQQVGGAYAERGLSRSTFSAEALNDVYATEYEQKLNSAVKIAQAKQDIQMKQELLDRKLAQAKSRLDVEKQQILLDATNEYNIQMQKQGIQNYYNELATNKMISAKERAQTKQLIQGIGSTAGALALSGFGPAGMIAGGIAGGALASAFAGG